MSSHIRLPDERVSQLRAIAEAKAKTIPEVIGDYIRSEIEAGTITGEIPGVDVAATEDGIRIVAGEIDVLIPMGHGPSVAEVLASAGSLTGATGAAKKEWLMGAAALSGIEIKRAGNGLKLVSPITKNEYSLSIDVASDLADVITGVTK